MSMTPDESSLQELATRLAREEQENARLRAQLENMPDDHPNTSLPILLDEQTASTLSMPLILDLSSHPHRHFSRWQIILLILLVLLIVSTMSTLVVSGIFRTKSAPTSTIHPASGLTSAVGKLTEFALPAPDSEPLAITSGPDGNLWFTEKSKIGRITPAGKITEFPLPTANSALPAITRGPDGNLWFTATTNSGEATIGSQIGSITPAGKVTEFPLSLNSYPSAITSGPDGNLWFTEEGTAKIGRITPAGGITEFSIPAAHSLPSAITSGSDSNLWFADYGSGSIGRITPEGTIAEFSLPAANSYPVMITSGPNGDLWFTEATGPEAVIQPVTNSKIGRITSDGTITEFSIPKSQTVGSTNVYGGISSGPTAITSGSDGNLWFTNLPGFTTQSGFTGIPGVPGQVSRIGRLAPSGQVTEFSLPTTDAYAYAITSGPDDNLWFTETSRINLNSGPATGGKIGRITSGK